GGGGGGGGLGRLRPVPTGTGRKAETSAEFWYLRSGRGTNMNMEIRDATASDVHAIARLLADDGLGRGRETPGDPVYTEAFARMSSQPGNVYMIAMEGSEVIACLQYTVIHGLSRSGASRAQIEGVRVSGAHRGRGLGESLMQAAIERARADGCRLVQLTTDRAREDAHRFYERLGFVASHHGMKLDLG
ncbi:MAG: GNAT family N-acetyltransferase, partial [Pseudomonadota bacterium]